MRHLFTTEPLPIPVASVPLARAMLCITCEAISVCGPTCPNCAGEQVMPLAAWMASLYSEPKATAR